MPGPEPDGGGEFLLVNGDLGVIDTVGTPRSPRREVAGGVLHEGVRG